MTSTIWANPATRVLHSETEFDTYPSWVLENSLDRSYHRVSLPIVTLTLLFANGGDRDDVAKEVAQRFSAPIDDIEKEIDLLLSLGILTKELSEAHREFMRLHSNWHSHGWSEALFHHYATKDYPFLDYRQPLARQEDVARMAASYSEESEIPWYKSYREAEERIPCGFASSYAEDHSGQPSPHANGKITASLIKEICSFAFGPVYHWDYNPNVAQPLVLKACPSGGARHPTEGYVLCKNIVGLDDGFYHFCAATAELEKICAFVDDLALKHLTANAPAADKPAAVFLLTSVFERNMYRYREPRTFRAVHLDAGHIVGAIVEMGKLAGLQPRVDFDVSPTIAEALIDESFLNEGAIVSVTLEEPLE